MPKFIGHHIPGATVANAENMTESGELVRITYAQAIRLPSATIVCSRDNTDRGSRGRMAKQWYRFFAPISAILSCDASTENMKGRAMRAAAVLVEADMASETAGHGG